MADFVTLSCPSCGGKLEITSDIERLACAHCGREQLVKRSDNVVSLSPVLDAIQSLNPSVDQNAAELAIQRLRREIDELEKQRMEALKTGTEPANSCVWPALLLIGIGIAAFLLPILSPAIGSDWSASLMVIAIAIIVIGVIGTFQRPSRARWDQLPGARLLELDELISMKHEELRRAKELVSM